MRIKVINNIAREGLEYFNDNYQLAAEIDNPHAIMVRSSQVDVDDYPSLLAIARAGAGVNNINIERATEKGICVFNSPGANANAVAELVLVMAGIGARNIVPGLDFCRSLAGHPQQERGTMVEEAKAQFRGMELAGKTLGVLGLGQIGVRVANRGIGQKMRVVGFDPQPALENIHALLPEVDLARSCSQVVRQANILSVHVPLTAKTAGLVDHDLLAQLPSGAMLLNYSRQEVVDEEAVRQALDTGRLALYICDFPASELLTHPQVIATPHIGAATGESEEQCAIMAARELLAYLEYGTVVRSVNFPTVESIPDDQVVTRLLLINRDRPGMIGFVSQLLGEEGINISSYVNESNGRVGYNIIDLGSPLPPSLLPALNDHPDVIRTRVITF